MWSVNCHNKHYKLQSTISYFALTPLAYYAKELNPWIFLAALYINQYVGSVVKLCNQKCCQPPWSYNPSLASTPMCKVIWPKIWGNFQWSQKEVVMFLNNSISLVYIPPLSMLSVSNRVVLLMNFQQQQNHNHKKYLLWHCSVAHTDLCLSSNLYVSGNITAKAKLAWLVRPRLPNFCKVKMLISGKNALTTPCL